MLNHVQYYIPGSEVMELPEVPGRLSCIYKRFEKDGLLARCDMLTPELASTQHLELVHDPEYVIFVSQLPTRTDEAVAKFVGDETLNIYSDGTKEACYLAAGSVIKACESVAQGPYDKAFCVVRPPGHHAKKNKAGGFCFLNNIAIGAQYLLINYPLAFKRILVVDWDVHHGNGTQSIFYGNLQVLFVSVHSSKVGYPLGNEWRSTYMGRGDGKGFNLNIPLEEKYGDHDLLLVLDELVLPLAREFNPDAIMISAGYDAAKGDKVGLCNVTPMGFATATEKLESVGNGRVVMVLEGGYNLPVIAECSSYCLRALLGDKDVLHHKINEDPLPSTKPTIDGIKKAMSRYWEIFKDPTS